MIAPAVFDELTREGELNRDVAVIRRSIQQIEAGEGQEVNTIFAEIRAALLAKKAAQVQGISE